MISLTLRICQGLWGISWVVVYLSASGPQRVVRCRPPRIGGVRQSAAVRKETLVRKLIRADLTDRVLAVPGRLDRPFGGTQSATITPDDVSPPECGTPARHEIMTLDSPTAQSRYELPGPARSALVLTLIYFFLVGVSSLPRSSCSPTSTTRWPACSSGSWEPSWFSRRRPVPR